jgi:hypothetical protein
MVQAPSLLAAPRPAPRDVHILPASRLTPTIGALVRAEDLPAGPDRAARLRALVVEHHVVFVTGFGTDEAAFTPTARRPGSRGTPT